MKTRILHVGAVLALALSVSTAWAQSKPAATTQGKGINPSLLAKAKAGDAKAEYELGQEYAAGKGVPQDSAEAVRWFRKAAEQGLVIAEARFASALAQGWGVTQSTAQALLWYQKAAEHGDAESALELGQIYQQGGPFTVLYQSGKLIMVPSVRHSAAIPKDYVKAASWYRKAADEGDAGAQNDLGQLYEDGQGVPQDYREAYFWLSLGEANGIVSTTNGVDDRDLAASHLTKAALLEVQQRTRKWFEAHPAKPR